MGTVNILEHQTQMLVESSLQTFVKELVSEFKSSPLPSPPVPTAVESYPAVPVNPREQLALVVIWLHTKTIEKHFWYFFSIK